jgi:hypothetical protein
MKVVEFRTQEEFKDYVNSNHIHTGIGYDLTGLKIDKSSKSYLELSDEVFVPKNIQSGRRTAEVNLENEGLKK